MEQIRLGNIYSEEFGSGFAGNVWDSNGISPTLTTGQGGSRTPLLLEAGHLEKGTGKHQSNIVFDPNGLCPTICAGMGVKQQPTMHLEVIAIDDDYKSREERVYDKTYPTLRAENNFIKVAEICAMRARDKTNTNYRGSANENFEQTLEINKEGVCNTITTVQKDNLVLELDKSAETEKSLRAEQSRAEQSRAEQSRAEQSSLIYVKQATKEGMIPMKIGGVADLNYPSSDTRRGRVIENGEVCPTLTTESVPNVLENWTWEINGEKYIIRIRKLTPKECWRLMSFSDEDFEKAEHVCSSTQLYKQAGNSIVEEVLCAIFREML